MTVNNPSLTGRPNDLAAWPGKGAMIFMVFAPMIGASYAIYTLWNRWVTVLDVALLIGGWWITGFGITLGYHRMITHRSFSAPKWLQFILLSLAGMTMEGGPLQWSTVHVEHHKFSDREGDPHSPLEGLFHAHLGWFFKGRTPDPERYVPHLAFDPLILFFERTQLLWLTVGLAIPLLIGGLGNAPPGTLWSWRFSLQALAWGGFARLLFTQHASWSVNSICHTFGSHEFETPDRSRNNLVVGILALGEGWHNNHHAFPRAAFHGIHWWQIDPSAYLIRFLEGLGIITNVVRIAPEDIVARQKRAKEDDAA